MKKRCLLNQLEATLFGNGTEFGRLEMSKDNVPNKMKLVQHHIQVKVMN